MKVSVVIPAYDAADTIAKTLESLLAQTSQEWEAIVVDDGSRDATAKLVGEFMVRNPRIRLIGRQNGGEAAARNSGIAEAHYDWLLFLDADDWIAPGHLEKLTAALDADPELDAVHCGYARVTPDGTLIVDPYQPPAGDMFAVWARRSAFPVHACIVRKRLVNAVGGFDPSFRKSPDWDLWQRIARTGARFGAVREVLAYYRMRPNAASLDAHQMLRDGLRVLKQGHAPDPRVPNPHPDHAAGAPPEGIVTQEFYLLSWCAGLLLGRNEDARPLLATLAGEQFAELDADAVAQCVYDAAPLPACEPPSAWEVLWPKIRRRVDAFFAALEAHALAPDLKHRAHDTLMRLALRHSPAWHPLPAKLARLEEAEQIIVSQRASLAALERIRLELERDCQGLQEECREWQRRSFEGERGLDRLRGESWVRLGLRLGILNAPATATALSETSHTSGGSRPGVQERTWRQEGKWTFRVEAGSSADLLLPPHDPELLRIVIGKAGTRRRWDVQLNQPGLRVVRQGVYRLRFRARADRPRSIGVGLARTDQPWTGLGFYSTIRLLRDWMSFDQELTADADDDNARIHFDVGGSTTAIELANVEFQELRDGKAAEPVQGAHPMHDSSGAR